MICFAIMHKMLRILVFVGLAALLVASDPTDGIREAARGWRRGAIRQDKALLDRYLAVDLAYEHGGGKKQTKAEYIADVTHGPAHYVSMTESGTKIRVYGKTAVLTGFVDIVIPKGDPYPVRTLEVYTENNGSWQLAQKESVRVPSVAAAKE
jgi:hypothetical protein